MKEEDIITIFKQVSNDPSLKLNRQQFVLLDTAIEETQKKFQELSKLKEQE